MNTLSIKLPKVLHEKLATTAKKRKKTKAAVIREALQEYLAKQDISGTVSAYELAKDYIGIIDDGPTDLSTNKKYMEGYGQ